MVSPLITIITPTYNRADYLQETIESVLSQGHANLEYIVLDDGSKDNTREVLERYNGRIIWQSHENMGETRTVNKGFEMSTGQIVAIINSDDPLLPNAIKSAVDVFKSNPELLVAYPDWNRIGPAGEVIESIQVPEFDYLHMLQRHNCFVGPGAFIHRKALTLIGGRDTSFKYVADFDYWLRLGLHGAFKRIPGQFATFRVHPNSASVSSKGGLMAQEHIRLMDKYYALPNLPSDVLKSRASAYAWANIVAAEMCGDQKWLAQRYILNAGRHDPRIIWEHVLAPTRITLKRRVPGPLWRAVRFVWRFIYN
jgi:glycosyltransferase involved in cell wall biosynthesis